MSIDRTSSFRIHRALLGVGVLLLLLAAGGCSSRGALTIDESGGGEAEIVVDLDSVFVSYYRDLAGSVGSDREMPIFDLSALQARFGQEATLELRGASVPAQGRLELTFAFPSLAAIAEDPRLGTLLSFEESGGGGRVSLTLTQEEIPLLISLAGIEEGSPIELLLPPPGGQMGSEEYREYLVWALEEYQSSERLRQTLDGAAVTVTIRTPQPIDQVVNGARIGPREARFTIQLLPFLTGEGEGRYELEY